MNERIKALRLDPDEHEERELPRRRPIALAVLGAVAALAVAALAWIALAPAPLAVQTVAARTLDDGAGRFRATVLEGTGHVVARRQATVSATLTGQLTEILHDEGAYVEEGELLARLDDSNLVALLELDQARLSAARQALSETAVRLNEARIELDRTRRLFEGSIVSQSALDAAEAAVLSLEARLEQGRELVEVAEKQISVRREEIDDTRIRAPFSGIVISQNAQLGEMVSPVTAGGGFTRTGIFTLVDMDSLEAEVHVSENYISRIRRGMPAEVLLDAHPELDVPATVTAIVPAADALKATFKVRLAFEERDPRIMPNMRLKVTFLEPPGEADPARAFPNGSSPPAGVVIPTGALEETAQGFAVYVVQGDVLSRRRVALGERRGDQAVVVEGLAPAERVVVPIPPGAADGVRVVEHRDS